MAKGSVNKVVLIGRLGADPDMRYSNSGVAVCKMKIATTELEKSGDEYKERTDWHSVICFGKIAESCSNYLAKGSRIYVEGGIKYGQYESNDGVKKYTTDIIVKEVQFLDKVDNDNGNRNTKNDNKSGNKKNPSKNENYKSNYSDDDEIPF